MPSDSGLNTKAAALFQAIFGAIVTLPDPTLYALIASLNTLSTEIDDRIGAVTGDATTTILGRLAAIESLLHCVCGDFPPPTTGDNACDSPVSTLSGALVTSGSYPGRVFPIWGDPPPSGLSIDGTGDLADAGVAVELSDSTGTYSYYVQSRAATHLRTAGGTTQYPNNVWLGLSPGASLAVSVPDGFTATVYLCYTPAAGFVDCVNVGSNVGNYTQLDTSAVFNSSYAVWASIPGVTTTDTETFSGHTYQWNTTAAVCVADAIGWTFTKNSGPDIRLLAKHGDGTFTSYTISSTPFTITDHTTTLWADLGSGGDTSAFSFQVCPGA